MPHRVNDRPLIAATGDVTIDDLRLEWALEKAELPLETASAQHVRRDGALVYAVPLVDQLALVASDGSVTLLEGSANPPTRATFSPEGIRRFRRRHHLELADVIDQVHKLLVAHVRFAEDWQPLLVSLWVVGTYLHVLFAFFGYFAHHLGKQALR